MRETRSDEDLVRYKRARIISTENRYEDARAQINIGSKTVEVSKVITEEWSQFNRDNVIIRGHSIVKTFDGRVLQEGIFDQSGTLTTRTVRDGGTLKYPPITLGPQRVDPEHAKGLQRTLDDPSWTKLARDPVGGTVAFRKVTEPTELSPHGLTVTKVYDQETGYLVRSIQEDNGAGNRYQEIIVEAFEIYDVNAVDPGVWKPVIAK